MEDKIKDFGKKLIEIRDKKGLRQNEVADLTLMSQRTIGRLERGEISNPSIDSLLEISKVYDKDIVSLYLSTVYGNYIIFQEIRNKINLNAMVLNKEALDDLSGKINIIKDSSELKAKTYDLKLYELFIDYLKGKITNTSLSLSFDEISSNKINKKNFSKISLSDIELRILLNIGTNSSSYKNIDKLEIMNKCIDQEENSQVKISAYNNLANFYTRIGNLEKALKIIDEGIEFSKKEQFLIDKICLYFTRFAILFKSNKEYQEDLQIISVLFKIMENKRIEDIISDSIKKILK